MTTIEWLKTLIQIDTTSNRSNLPFINEIKSYLLAQDAIIRLTHDSDHLKANLFATLPARNGNTKGGIIFSGHTDVVPVSGQDWNSDPFKALQIEDKIYGRGTADMKGFLAVLLFLIPEFKRLALSFPIHFAFSYDEEVGCIGAKSMIADIQAADIAPLACIVGEPTEMRPTVAHKGLQMFRCNIHGQSAHSSLTSKACNPVEYAAKLICYLHAIANQFKQKGPFDPNFDVPFTTMTSTMVKGGTASNIIPEECELLFEFRQLPDVNPDDILAQIQTYLKTELLPAAQHEFENASLELVELCKAPSFEAEPHSKIREIVFSVSGEKNIQKVAYATEAGLFQEAQIPTMICGPGNIKDAHRANEFVNITQLKQCEDFLLNVVKAF